MHCSFQIGSYNTTHQLKISINFDLQFESNCDPTGACDECTQINQESTRFMELPSPNGLNIATFINIHNADPTDPFKCGELLHSNFQGTLAFFYAIKQINEQNILNLPADIKLGGIAIDVCGNPLSAHRDLYSLMSGQGLCYGDTTISAADILAYNVHTGSSDALSFQNALSPLKVLTMSAAATSPELSDKPFFLRTVPSDDLQAKIMVELARQMEWYYVGIVTSEGWYGDTSARDFMMNAKGGNDIRQHSTIPNSVSC